MFWRLFWQDNADAEDPKTEYQIEMDERAMAIRRQNAEIHARKLDTITKCVKLYTSLCQNGEIDEEAREKFKESLMSI